MSAESRRRLVEAGWTLGAAALVAAFCLLLLARDPGFFWIDDYQSQTLPGFYEIAQAWRRGEWPLLTPGSWFGGDFAGEYQYGVFSIVMMAAVVAIFSLGLSMAQSAAALGILHLMILAAGAFRLGRRYQLGPALAMFVAVVTALNGWVLLWGARNWLPALTSFAWLPWAWWAFERALDRDRGLARFVLPGVFMYLLLAAGGPSGIVLMAVVTTWIGLREWIFRRNFLGVWPLVAGWAMGLGLAAPALMALREMVAQSLRSEAVGQWVSVWLVPAPALPGLILPSFPATWQVFGRQVVRPAFELAGAFLPLAILVARAIGPRAGFFRANAWLLLLALGVLVVSMLPGLASFRWSFKWLPLFHLALALAAARALSWQPETPWRVRPAGVAFALALLTWGAQEWVGGAEAGARTVALLTVLLSAAWALAEGLASSSPLMRWGPVVLVLLTLWLPYTRLALWWVYTPSWPIPERVREARPLDPAVRYLSLYTYNELFTFPAAPDLFPVLRPGNSAMWAGLELINGYSAMSLKGITWNFQFDGHGPPREQASIHFLQREAGRDGLLAQYGIDGLIVSNALWGYVPSSMQADWTLAWDTPVGKVLHRKTRSPRVWSAGAVQRADSAPSAFGLIFQRPSGASVPTVVLAQSNERVPPQYAPVRVDPKADRRLEAEIAVEASPSGPGLVVLARPWYPGYRAWLNSAELPVRLVQNVLIGVEVPQGARGTLKVAYLPSAVTLGLPVALGTSLFALAFWLVARRRRISAPAMPSTTATPGP